MDSGGWYPDPTGGDPGRVRWWDGRQWTEHTADRDDPRTGGPPDVVPDVVESGSQHRRMPGRLPWLATAAVVVALVVTAVVVNHHDDSTSATDNSDQPAPPPIATLCTKPDTARPAPGAPPTRPSAGPRITDPTAHVSYAAQPGPFRAWDFGTWGSTGGAGLGESFTVGQYFITQASTPAGTPYLASVLSGTVPATYGDDPHPDVQCAARAIADDVRRLYYPQPNVRRDVTARARSVSGRPAYELQFHLAFDRPGYTAHGEQVGICVVDVPGPSLAAVYVSIPDTHRRYDPVIDRVIDSIALAQ